MNGSGDETLRCGSCSQHVEIERLLELTTVLNLIIDQMEETLCIVANEQNCAPDRDDSERVVVSLHRADLVLIRAMVAK